MQLSTPSSILHFALLATSILASPGLAQGPAPVRTHPGDQALGTAVGAQESPVFAPGATSTLAVWSDARADLTVTGPFIGEQTGRDIYAARFDLAGNRIDATPLPLAVEVGEQTSPRAVWDGQQWLVTWIHQTPTQFFYDYRVFGIRVAEDGSLLDPVPFEILAAGGNDLITYDLASNGENCLVIAQADTGGGIQARRVSNTGALLDLTPVTLIPGTFFLYFDVQLESAGGEYLLTYDGTQSSTDAWQARRYDGDLNQLGVQFSVPLGTVLSASQSTYLLVSTGTTNVMGQRMLPNGTLLDPAPFPITSPGTHPVSAVRTAFDGVQWWIGYDVGGAGAPELRGSRVTLAGAALDLTGVPIAPATASIYFGIGPALGGGLYTVWEQGPSFVSLRAARTSPELLTGADFPLAVSAPSQEFVDSAPWSGGHALAWTSYSGDGNRILVQLTDDRGLTSSAPLEVASGAVGVARIAWNGSLFLVTWSAGGQALGRRMHPDGTFLDATPITVMTGGSPDVDALGGNFLVVATDVFPGLGPQFIHPYFVRVEGATGALLDPEPRILGQYFARNPRVTTAGDRWLVTWQRNFSHDNPASEIRAAFVDELGTATADFNVGSGGTPNAAASDSTALFVWRSGTSSSSNFEILARPMAIDGTFVGPTFTAATAADKQQRPTLTWTGEHFFLAWEDMRESTVFFDERTHVFGARFSEAGVPLDGNGLAFLGTEMPVKRPALSTSNGVTLLSASELDLSPGLASYRLRSTVANALVASPAEVSLGAGGIQAWSVDAGSGLAGHFYWVLGTLSPTGTSPAGSVDLALVADAYFSATLSLVNSPLFPQSLGLLDGTGHGAAGMAVPAGTDPSLAGAQLFHAFAVFDPSTFGVEWGSNRTSLQLVP